MSELSRYETIAAKAQELMRKFDTCDPFALAKALNIEILRTDEWTKLKGMYFCMKRRRFICLNSNLDEHMMKIVCAHEIGHDQLHRQLAKEKALQEFMLYDMSSRPEYEANVFAASVLLDDSTMLRHIYEDHYDAQQIACAMNSDINLVALKAAELTKKGYPLNQFESRSDFLA